MVEVVALTHIDHVAIKKDADLAIGVLREGD
jgi:hypothetical protein